MDDLIKSLNEFIENSNTEFDRYSYDQLQELCEAMKPYFQNAMAPINETHEETKPEEEPEELPEPEEEKKPEEDAEPEEITKDDKAAAQKKINGHIQSLKATLFDNLERETSILDNPAAKIYVIGDIEGHIQLLYNWFINEGLIDHELNWKGDENTYVVQCGDQLDSDEEDDHSSTRINLGDHSDLEVIIFMDYLNKISNNHVLNILGNHEIMNLQRDFRYAKIRDQPYLTENFRKKLFDIDTDNNANAIIKKILFRRNFIIRINKCIFCHGGITNDIFRFDDISSLDVNIQDINNIFYLNQYKNLNTISSNILRIIYQDNGILWNRFDTSNKFPTVLKENGYKVFTGHNSYSDINFIEANSDNSIILPTKLSFPNPNIYQITEKKFNDFDMIIADVKSRQNEIVNISSDKEYKCIPHSTANSVLAYVLVEEKESKATAKYFSCCLPKCADIDIFTNVLRDLAAELIKTGGGISEDISYLIEKNTALLEKFKDKDTDFQDYRRLRIAINNFIEHVLFIGLVLKIFEHFNLSILKIQIGFIKTIKDSINELKDRSDKEMKTYIRLIKNLIQFRSPYTQYYNIRGNDSNFEKLLLVLDDKIISQKVSDLKFKLSIYQPPENIKAFINALSNRDKNISQDISEDQLFEILDYILSNRAHGVDINYSTENFAVLNEDKAPDNFVKIDLDSLALPSIYIFVKSKCTNALVQFSGTCYFNAVINGVFLSNNFYKFLKHKLVEYYNSLSEEEKQQFKAQGMTCLAREKLISREILLNLIKHYLCAINHQFEKIEGSEITEIASAILHKEEVNEGGISNEVIDNILNILFGNDRESYCKIKIYPEEIGTVYEGYILDHAVLAIQVKGDRASHMNHAVVGTYCYEDKEPNPIIIDSNRPYNPIYIDWKDPKNNETIIEYFKSVYTYKERSELQIVYDYVCYLNEEKLKESKKFILKKENEEILEVCTNYKKD